MPATTPSGCAEWICRTPAGGGAGTCALVAKDADKDSYRAAICKAIAASVTVEVGADCDDTKATVYPLAPETCNNVDDNCNGVVDDGIPPTGSCTVGKGKCISTGQLTCANGAMTKCNAVEGTPESDAPRCDGQDYACDGDKQVGCSCTVGGKLTGSSTDATKDPKWGSMWCRRNCEVTKVACNAGKFECPDPNENELDKYCDDHDHDRYFNASKCDRYCKEYRPSGLPGAPAPLKAARPADYISPDNHQADCDDGNATIHVNAPELCLPANVDENCDGNPYNPPSVPKPGTPRTCTKGCGPVRYTGSHDADAACSYQSACVAAAGDNFGLVRVNGVTRGLTSVPVDLPWTHVWGNRCDGDQHWCAEGSGSDDVVRGPGVTLPAGNYVLHVQGSHSTSSTWVFIEDNGQGVGGAERHFIAPTAFKQRFDTDIAFFVPPGSDCHTYDFKVHATPNGWFNYGVTTEKIWLTRQ